MKVLSYMLLEWGQCRCNILANGLIWH